MITEAKGVDTSKLTEPQRGVFFRLINTEPSACGKPHSLAKSLQTDAECRDSMLVAQYIADRIAGGASASAVKAELADVAESLVVRDIPVTGRPVFGNERAPVTLVVFADFECPHCKAEAPVLRKAINDFSGRARLVYKHFPLGMHPQAKVAAIATEAAFRQGKFWEMHDKVFAGQADLSNARLRQFAQELGLDLARFDADMKDPALEAIVMKDRADGEKLELRGTPAVYVNGRYVNGALFGGNLNAWIDDALKR
jgi:protein-disulfide isomerase